MAKGEEGRSFATVLELKAFAPEQREYEVRDRKVTNGKVAVRTSGVLSYLLRYQFKARARSSPSGSSAPTLAGWRRSALRRAWR